MHTELQERPMRTKIRPTVPLFSLCLLLTLLLAPVAFGQEAAQETPAAPAAPAAPAEPAPASAEMAELARYIGDWDSNLQKDPTDREYRFHYRLEWYDRARSLVKMTIYQNFTDGEDRLLWEGFKGWNPMEEKTFYYGFSPSGRAGFGGLRKEGEMLHTEYDAKGPRGGLKIRDTFTPLSEDSFRSETYLLRGDSWQKMTDETWTRRK
jgi:hypothetical protein